MQIVTNNPKVLSSYPGVRWVSGGPLEVLIESRSRVQAGFALLTHPLMGDIHLLGNPFRSVILADEKEDVHLASLRWIEDSIEKIRHHSPKSKAVRGMEDYQAVDFELVQTAIRGDSLEEGRGGKVCSLRISPASLKSEIVRTERSNPMIEVNTENFEKEVVRSSEPVLVDFWGPQCGPCLALMPQVEALREKYQGRVKMAKVEAPKSRRLCLNLKVMGLPTFLFFKDGKEIGRLTGNITIQSIEESLKKFPEANG